MTQLDNAMQEVPQRPTRAPRSGISSRWLKNGLLQLPMAIIVLIPIVCIAVPLGVMISLSVRSAPFGTAGAHFTWSNFSNLFDSPQIGSIFTNTIILTIGSAFFATVLGSLLAWIVTMTNCPFKRVMFWLPVLPITVPVLTKDLSWIMLYNNRTGLVNIGFNDLLGVKPFNIYSLPGMIADLTFSTTPLVYLIMAPALASIGKSLTEASLVVGARRLKTLSSIIFPVVRPALLSAFAIATLLVATAFETPILIGTPGGIATYISTIYDTTTGPLANYNLASAQSVVYVAISFILLMLYFRASRSQGRFEVVTGRGYVRGVSFEMGRWRWLLFAVVVGFFLLAFVQLVVANVITSFLPFFTVTNGNPFRHWTLSGYTAEFNSGSGLYQTLGSSVWTAIVVSLLTTAIGTVLAVVAVKGRSRARRIVETVATLPIGVPSLVLGVAMFVTVLFVPTIRSLYNTTYPLIVASVVVFLPFAVRIMANATVQIHDELLEAARVSGAGWFRSNLAILVPLLRLAMGSTLLLVFVLSFRELGAVVLLLPANFQLLPVAIFEAWETGSYLQATVLNTISLIVPMVIVGVALTLRWVTLRALRYRVRSASRNVALVEA
jgi:iron(III) transport system permease protein